MNVDDNLKELAKQARDRSLTLNSFITILTELKEVLGEEAKVSGISSYSIGIACTKTTERVDDEYVIKEEVVLNL